MFRSNNLLGIPSFMTLLFSILILGKGIWFSTRGSTDCEKFLEGPFIALGIFIMVFSLAGLVDSYSRFSCLIWVHLLFMFLVIVLSFCFIVFAFVVTHKGTGEIVTGRGYKEYRLGDYSDWLQKWVNDSKNWNRIKGCLADDNVCKKLGESMDAETVFYQRNLSPTQSGCCKPPTSCQFTYVNATFWNKPEGSTNAYADSDCLVWNNDQKTLCYNCQSCKAGVLANLKKGWKKVAVVSIIYLIMQVFVYSLVCFAFRNNRADDAWKGC